jgi:hypothetical protein
MTKEQYQLLKVYINTNSHRQGFEINLGMNSNNEYIINTTKNYILEAEKVLNIIKVSVTKKEVGYRNIRLTLTSPNDELIQYCKELDAIDNNTVYFG